MDLTTLPVLSLAADPADFARDIGQSFRQFGFAMVKDHGVDDALVNRAWDLTEQFFALPEDEKRAYFLANGGARGYTPFKTEIAKGATRHDLKEFWHVGRDLPEGSPLAGPSMPANIWPSKPEGFEETFRALYAALDDAGARILSAIARDLGLDAHWFDKPIEDGNSVLRLLHYPPSPTPPKAPSARARMRTSTSSPCCWARRKRVWNC
jgi:isopenicillin N synthase-like dioxygenase